MAEKSFASTIKTIYFYFFSALGLILIIIGVFQLSQWGVKSFVLPRYDLGYEESRCEFLPTKLEMRPSDASDVGQSQEECEEALSEQRRVRQVTDFANAITLLFVGGALFVFHFRRTSLLNK